MEDTIRGRHLTDYLQRNAQNLSDKTAIVFDDESLNWSELWQKVETAGSILGHELPNDKQVVVTMLLANSIDFVVAYLAILHAGHIAFPLDPAYKTLELDAIVDEIPSALLVTDSIYRQQLGEHNTPFLMVESLYKKPKKPSNGLRFPADKQIASLTFTSGTTGTPKAVPNTHANHMWNIEVCSKVWDWTTDDSLLISLPLSHWYGIVMGLSGALYHGNTLYLLDQRFNSHKILEMLSSGRITIFTHISVLYLKLLETEGQYDLSKLRLCISGGAPLPPQVCRDFKKRYGVEILETYGSSETGRIAANELGQPVIGSPGKILPGVKVKLSPEGEVLVKSPGIFPGYFSNQAATKAAYTSDGYFRTGDIGEMRGDYLFLKGRIAERIRRFGYTVSPRDVEWAMHRHPQINDIYVMGRQKKDSPNDELIYFVVSNLDDKAIIEYSRQNLIFAWRPDKIIHLPKLPRTASGKPKVVQFKQLVSGKAR